MTVSDPQNFISDEVTLPFTVAPGDYHSLAVRFKPITSGIHNASLTLTLDDSDMPSLTVPLSGNAGIFTLAINKEGVGGGTVVSDIAGIDCGDDCSETYQKGTEIILTASPDAGFVFKGWLSGSCTGTDECHITLNSDTLITVRFGLQKADINADKSDAIRALQISAGQNPQEIIYTDASVNSDKKIGVDESVYILQKIAEMR